jgi:hypothetical protein
MLHKRFTFRADSRAPIARALLLNETYAQKHGLLLARAAGAGRLGPRAKDLRLAKHSREAISPRSRRTIGRAAERTGGFKTPA